MDETTQSPRRRGGGRISLLAALIVVVVAALSLVVVLLDRDPGTPQGRPPSPTPPVTAGSATAGSASAVTCPADTATTLAGPPTVQWQPLGQMTLPFGAARYGPCSVTATTATGYARTPGGALIAAIQIFSRSTTSAPAEVAVATVSTQFVANSDRDILLRAAQSSPRQSLPPERVGHLAAYQVAAFTADAASVMLAFRADAMPGQYVVMKLVLQWVDGDWRMVAPLTGSWAGAGQVLTQLPGFTTWGP